MSHYTVSVITPNKPNPGEIDDLLAPYDENLQMAPYIYKTYKEVKESYYNLIEKEMNRDHSNDPDWPDHKIALENLKPLLDTDDVKAFLGWVDKNHIYDNYEQLDYDGNALSTYNPDSKWDWYDIGGRWGGAIEGNNSVPLSSIKPTIVQGEKTEEELKKEFPKEYKEYQTITTEGNGWYSKEYLLELYPTFEDYLLSSNNFETYAILTPEGQWLEPGRMGWFGMSGASPEEERQFTNNFHNTLEDIKKRHPEAWLTVVDCHI